MDNIEVMEIDEEHKTCTPSETAADFGNLHDQEQSPHMDQYSIPSEINEIQTQSSASKKGVTILENIVIQQPIKHEVMGEHDVMHIPEHPVPVDIGVDPTKITNISPASAVLLHDQRTILSEATRAASITPPSVKVVFIELPTHTEIDEADSTNATSKSLKALENVKIDSQPALCTGLDEGAESSHVKHKMTPLLELMISPEVPYINKKDKATTHSSNNEIQTVLEIPQHTSTSQATCSKKANVSKSQESSSGYVTGKRLCASTFTTKGSTTKKSPVEEWTKEEKYQLYVQLKNIGSRNVRDIHLCIPTKTYAEIETAIAYYKDRANEKPERKKIKVRKVKPKPLIPLATWSKLLLEHYSFNELQTDVPNAMRIIADMEDIPAPIYTDNIDFRKIYHQIADVMEGKSLVDNRLTKEVLNSCVLDTALVSKTFMKHSVFRNIMNSISFKDKQLPVFPRFTPDSAMAIARHFSLQKNYNPLNISEEYLKPISVSYQDEF